MKKQQMASIAATGVRDGFFLAGLGLGGQPGMAAARRGGPAASSLPQCSPAHSTGTGFQRSNVPFNPSSRVSQNRQCLSQRDPPLTF